MKERFYNFMLKPASAQPLAALRISLGVFLLSQAYMLRGSLYDFFSSSGYIQGDLVHLMNNPMLPQIAWLHQGLARFSVSEEFCIVAVASAYLLSLLFLTAGLFTRIASVAAWFLHWTLMNSAESTTYGVDLYTHVFLFYLMWVPAGDAWSIDSLRSPQGPRVSSAARLGLRIMQLHLCVSYLASGIEKAQGIQWWNGELFWRATMLPVYKQYDFSWLAHWPGLSMVAGWATLLLETGYCVFIWPRATRKFWLVGIVGLHLGIVFLLGLTLFGLVMVILSVSLFALSAEPELEPAARENRDEPFFLFDGDCYACDSAVRMVLRFDRNRQFRFLPLQSPRGQELLRAHNFATAQMDTMVVINGVNLFTNSRAIFEVCRIIGGPFAVISLFRLLPQALTDGFYRLFSRNRVRLFGESRFCRLPILEDRSQLAAQSGNSVSMSAENGAPNLT